MTAILYAEFLGLGLRETLVSLTVRLALWIATAFLAYGVLRPLQPAMVTETGR